MSIDLEHRTRYDPAEVESRVRTRWLDSGLFHPEPAGTAEENYSIAIPLPNVTGALHMGHALNGSVQDTLIRLARMRGKRTKWIFGTDHAGIGTQTLVERALRAEGTSREELGPRQRSSSACGAGATSTAPRSSSSSSASAPRRTTRTSASRSTRRTCSAVQKVFVDLYDKGLIYRDNYMVNWDPGSQSAISDLEVEQREVTDTLYYVDYPLESGHGSLTIATVRPETILADTAIAVHPDDDRYTRLIGEVAILPIVGRRLKIIADEYVKPEFGTGALKITPGHDPNDFEIGRAHGLEEVSVIGEDGRMTAAAGEFEGMTALEAREAVVEKLRAEGRIARAEQYRHDVPYSQRSGERIEPLISLQWFMRMDELARPAIEVVESGRVRIHPEGQRRRYLEWMENIRPWCISRQLWWGHQIPVWYRGDETYAGMEPPAGRRLGARPRRARHVVLERHLAVRHARLAGPDGGAEGLLSDRRPLDGARHPLPLGRPHGHVRARVRRRRPVRRRLRAPGHPGARRAPDVEVARHGDRPAVPDRRRPAPAGVRARAASSPPTAPTPCAGGCWPAPRPRTCASTRSASPRAASSPTSCGTPRGSCCCACPRGSRCRRRRPRPRRSRTAGSSRACRPPRPTWPAPSTASSSTSPPCASTTSSTASCATGTWR